MAILGRYTRSRQPGNKKPVIIDGGRTAFVKSFSSFEECDALELYSRTIAGLIQKTGVDANEIDEITCGVVVPQTKNGNVARDTIINLGLSLLLFVIAVVYSLVLLQVESLLSLIF